MKELINGLVYDTETAEAIAKYETKDFLKRYSATYTLYKTATGNYFIHCKPEAQNSFQLFTGGCKDQLAAVSKQQAIEWLAQLDLWDAIDEHFPGELEQA